MLKHGEKEHFSNVNINKNNILNYGFLIIPVLFTKLKIASIVSHEVYHFSKKLFTS